MRYGCITCLAALAIVGALATWLTGWGDDGAGTRLAFALAFGLLIVYVGSLIESLTTRRKLPPNSPDAPPPSPDRRPIQISKR